MRVPRSRGSPTSSPRCWMKNSVHSFPSRCIFRKSADISTDTTLRTLSLGSHSCSLSSTESSSLAWGSSARWVVGRERVWGRALLSSLMMRLRLRNLMSQPNILMSQWTLMSMSSKALRSDMYFSK